MKWNSTMSDSTEMVDSRFFNWRKDLLCSVHILKPESSSLKNMKFLSSLLIAPAVLQAMLSCLWFKRNRNNLIEDFFKVDVLAGENSMLSGDGSTQAI